jgi:hypothetical protein
MRRALALCALLLASPVLAAPASPSAKDAQTWIDHTIKPNGWTLLGYDGEAVSYGSASGVSVLDEGILEAQIRQEYYRPRMFGDLSSLSNVQTWMVDCKAGRNRVISTKIYAGNNLSDYLAGRGNVDADWQDRPAPGSADASAIAALCKAAANKKRPDPGGD